jgi:hypothetical protein
MSPVERQDYVHDLTLPWPAFKRKEVNMTILFSINMLSNVNLDTS